VMNERKYHPHISLGVSDNNKLNISSNELKEFSNSSQPLKVCLSSIGIFPTVEGVIFLGVTVTKELLGIHSKFYQKYPKWSDNIRSYYLPGNWVPHCTLAYGLNMKSIPEAIKICSNQALPIIGKLNEIALVEVPSGEIKFQIPLGKINSAKN